MSRLYHLATRPEEDMEHWRGAGRVHHLGEQHRFLNFLLPLLGAAVKTVAVGAVTQLATNAVTNLVGGGGGGPSTPTVPTEQPPTPTYEDVGFGAIDVYETEPAGVPFEAEPAMEEILPAPEAVSAVAESVTSTEVPRPLQMAVMPEPGLRSNLLYRIGARLFGEGGLAK